MAAMAMVLSWKIVADFQSFVKKKIQNFDPQFKNLYFAKKNAFKKLSIGLV
jgi:hypothetical protein